MTTITEDEILFKNIIDNNLTHRGKVSVVVLECLRDAGYNLKLIKIGENQKPYIDDNQIILNVDIGKENSIIRDATLEFKIKNYPYVIKNFLNAISQELENIK